MIRLLLAAVMLCGVAAADNAPLARAVETYLGADRLTGVDESAPTPKWRYRATLIVWAADLEGNADILGTRRSFDIPFSDTLEKLQFAANTRFAARTGRWAIICEFFFINLRDSSTNALGGTNFSKTRWFFVELSVNYVLLKEERYTLSVIGGARYHNVEGEVGVRNAPSPSATEQFVDPLVGFDLRVYRGKWKLIVRGDIGGFGASTELTWRVFVAIERRISERYGVGLGYAWLETDFDDGAGGNRLDAVVRAQGAGLFLTMNF